MDDDHPQSSPLQDIKKSPFFDHQPGVERSHDGLDDAARAISSGLRDLGIKAMQGWEKGWFVNNNHG